MIDNKVWDPMELSNSDKFISYEWVCKTEKDFKDRINKYKQDNLQRASLEENILMRNSL